MLLASLELPPSDPLAADRAAAVLEQMIGAELRPAGSRGVRLLSARAVVRLVAHTLDDARAAVERTLVAAAEQSLAEGNVRRLRHGRPICTPSPTTRWRMAGATCWQSPSPAPSAQ